MSFQCPYLLNWCWKSGEEHLQTSEKKDHGPKSFNIIFFFFLEKDAFLDKKIQKIKHQFIPSRENAQEKNPTEKFKQNVNLMVAVSGIMNFTTYLEYIFRSYADGKKQEKECNEYYI